MSSTVFIAKEQVVVIGAGSFGSAIANRISLNVEENEGYENVVKLWVFDEIVNGRNLSDIINDSHENTKYLPGTTLSSNVIATTSLSDTIEGADYVVIVLPHQHIKSTLQGLAKKLKPNAIVISMTKGIKVSEDGPELISDIIRKELNCDDRVVVMMGANVASEVALNQVVDSTVASSNPEVAEKVARLFNCHCFRTQVSTDVSTVELCGALKNVVALGAGICDGLNQGHSSKAALLRQGLHEIGEFCKLINPISFRLETLLESCGFPDLVASSYGGRNRLCAMEYTQRRLRSFVDKSNVSNKAVDADVGDVGASNNGINESVHLHQQQIQKEQCPDLWIQIESELLNGQSLQGIETCRQVMAFLEKKEYQDGILNNCTTHGDNGIITSLKSVPSSLSSFKLFRKIHGIAVNGEDPRTLFDW